MGLVSKTQWQELQCFSVYFLIVGLICSEECGGLNCEVPLTALL